MIRLGRVVIFAMTFVIVGLLVFQFAGPNPHSDSQDNVWTPPGYTTPTRVKDLELRGATKLSLEEFKQHSFSNVLVYLTTYADTESLEVVYQTTDRDGVSYFAKGPQLRAGFGLGVRNDSLIDNKLTADMVTDLTSGGSALLIYVIGAAITTAVALTLSLAGVNWLRKVL